VPDEYGCVIGDGLHGYRTTPLEAFNAFVPNRTQIPRVGDHECHFYDRRSLYTQDLLCGFRPSAPLQ
jgi:hypothetical protein